jgi:hypothetical protein
MKKLIKKTYGFVIVSILLLNGCGDTRECKLEHAGDGVYPYDICDLDMEAKSEDICFIRRCK